MNTNNEIPSYENPSYENPPYENPSYINTPYEIPHAYDNNILPQIKIITVRGIKCISTIPYELIWGQKGTCLECPKCLEFAVDRLSKILIGICAICAKKYDYKYGCGYFLNLYEYEGIPLAFGNLDIEYVTDKLYYLTDNTSEQYQIANNPKHSWSIYDMTIRLSKSDLNLLTKKNNYGWQELNKHYETKDILNLEKYLAEILDIVRSLQEYYKLTDNEGNIINEKVEEILFNKNFYNECCEYQSIYPENKYDDQIAENEETAHPSAHHSEHQSAHNYDSDLYKHKCDYCKIIKVYKKMQKCSNCFSARYCSIACQTHDWEIKHKESCSELLQLSYYTNTTSFNNRPIEDID